MKPFKYALSNKPKRKPSEKGTIVKVGHGMRMEVFDRGKQVRLNTEVIRKCPQVAFRSVQRTKSRTRMYLVFRLEDKAKLWYILNEQNWKWQWNTIGSKYKGREYIGMYRKKFAL